MRLGQPLLRLAGFRPRLEGAMKLIAVPENEISTAFAALAEVAEVFAGQGRRCFAATAKPALRARLNGFDETLLGYATFREFLIEAQRRGVVKLAFVAPAQWTAR